MSVIPDAPAPWELTGNGYVLLYRLPREMAQQYVKFGEYRGGFSVLMVVEYTASNVGPYHEILFIPGRIRYPGGEGYSISKILVSTEESVVNGIENWGIPKEIGQFDRHSIDLHTQRVTVVQNNQPPVFDGVLNAGGFPFPAYGFVLPPVVQFRDGMTFKTKIRASGQGQFAHVIRMQTNSDDLPPLEFFSPLLALKVSGFKMTFPIPEVSRGSAG